MNGLQIKNKEVKTQLQKLLIHEGVTLPSLKTRKQVFFVLFLLQQKSFPVLFNKITGSSMPGQG